MGRTILTSSISGGVGGSVARNAPHLSLPGKLVFPSSHSAGHFSMLGLGDIVMPGLLLCFVMRYDAYKKAQQAKLAEAGIPLPSNWMRISYFHCSLFGYFLGLLTATISSEVSATTTLSQPLHQVITPLFPDLQSGPTSSAVSGTIHTVTTICNGLPKR